MTKLPSSSGSTVANPSMSGALARVHAEAENLANKLGDSYVATEHLLIALTKVKSPPAQKILSDVGVTEPKLAKRSRMPAAASGSPRRTPRQPRGPWTSTPST